MGTPRGSPRCVAFLLVFLTARVAVADDALAEMILMVRELRYEEAVTRSHDIRARSRTPPADRLRAIELEAIANLGLGDEEAARRAFIDLLRLDPGHVLTLDRPSPRVADLFRRVREERPRAPAEDLVVAVAAPRVDGAPAVVTALPTGETALARLVFRSVVNHRDAEIEASPGGPPWHADIPLESMMEAAGLEVLANGYAPSGELASVSAVGRVPVPEEPRRQQVGHRVAPAPASAPDTTPPREEPSVGLAERPWFWVVIGAVVVVGTASLIVLGLTADTSTPPRTAE